MDIAAIRPRNLEALRSIAAGRDAASQALETLDAHGLSKASKEILGHAKRGIDASTEARAAIQALDGQRLLSESTRRNAHWGGQELRRAADMIERPRVYGEKSVRDALEEASIRLRISHESGAREIERGKLVSPPREESSGNWVADDSEHIVWGGRWGENDIDGLTGEYPRSALDEFGEQVYPPGSDEFSGELPDSAMF